MGPKMDELPDSHPKCVYTHTVTGISTVEMDAEVYTCGLIIKMEIKRKSCLVMEL